MERERADVVIVGASPAGLTAAREAALGGADVLLCEARAAIGDPPSPAAVMFDALLPEATVIPPGVVARSYCGARLVSPRGATLPLDAPARLLDRTRFDRHLAREAERAGARIRTGSRFHRAMRGRLEGDGLVAEAPLLLFADGPGSLAGVFLEPLRDPHLLVKGSAYAVRAPGIGENAWIDLSVGRHAPYGRSQLNPLHGDAASLWLFHHGSPPDLGAACRLHETALALAPGTLRPKLLGDGLDPVLALPRDLVASGVLVAGGAAGQAGIELGLAAGALAGRVAAQATAARDTSREALLPYAREWRRRHQAGLLAHRRGMDLLQRLSDDTLHRLVTSWSGKALPPRLLLDVAHPSPLRRARALLASALRNPRAAPLVARAMLLHG